MDAPETGGVGAAIGGAKCEKERGRGFDSKEFIVEFTRNKEIQIINYHGKDRHGLHVVDLAIDKSNLTYIGLHSGALKHWPHVNGKALRPKPDWCS